MTERISKHYDADYFAWQTSIGNFGGWANQSKFSRFIKPDFTVLDFGCGGGYLLKGLTCARRIGVEVNPAAAETAKANGVEVYGSVVQVPDNTIDIMISNNALEHALHPLTELKDLYDKLKPGGKAVFVVPCESISYCYKPGDVNYHLYSWSPMCIGNLFTEAGFNVIESRPYFYKWPPFYLLVARIGGRPLFDFVCRIYGHIARKWFHVRVIAEKRA